MSDVPRDYGTLRRLHRDLEERHIVFIRSRWIRPRHGDHVLLELKRGQECFTPNPVDGEPGAGEHVTVFTFDSIVESELEPPA